MLHALREFGRAIPRGEASMNFRRVLYRRMSRKFIADFLLHGKRDGVFVDVGAYDGIALSNTYYFEKELGWSGICIEPNPLAFESLSQNRKCVSLNCGVGGQEELLEFLKLPGDLDLGSGFIRYLDLQRPILHCQGHK